MEREKTRAVARASLLVGTRAMGDIVTEHPAGLFSGFFPQATFERALSGTQPL